MLEALEEWSVVRTWKIWSIMRRFEKVPKAPPCGLCGTHYNNIFQRKSINFRGALFSAVTFRWEDDKDEMIYRNGKNKMNHAIKPAIEQFVDFFFVLFIINSIIVMAGLQNSIPVIKDRLLKTVDFWKINTSFPLTVLEWLRLMPCSL